MGLEIIEVRCCDPSGVPPHREPEQRRIGKIHQAIGIRRNQALHRRQILDQKIDNLDSAIVNPVPQRDAVVLDGR